MERLVKETAIRILAEEEENEQMLAMKLRKHLACKKRYRWLEEAKLA